MRDWGDCYQKIETRSSGLGNLMVWRSIAVRDPLWDDFLRSTPCGQFQQSGLWADYKAGEGWVHHRVILTEGDATIGGFQILWRKSRLGRIGYVSKGPVANPETPACIGYLQSILKETAVELGLSALIIQPPDESRTEVSQSDGRDFIPSNPMGVIEATYLIDLRVGKDVLLAKMSASLRRNIRKGRKLSVSIRIGTRNDLPRFFELMEATCRRQSTKPNPGSLDAIRRLWDIFSPLNAIRLTIADCQGDTPAALLSLVFGDRMTLWKKGRDGSHSQCRSNELLEYDAINWAHDNGYRLCDFCSFNRTAATKLTEGRPAAELDLSSRDAYHMRFGGSPRLLPAASIYFPNAFYRWWYRHGYVPERLRNRQ